MTEAGPPDLRGAAHVLVVDDDARLRALLARYLRREGYRVSTAAQALDARAVLDLFEIDLIVLDVMMPGESGLEFARALRASCGPQALAPIVMLTARALADDRIAGFESGVDDYLTKPFEPRELALRIAAILRRAQPRRAPALAFGPFLFDFRDGALRRAGALVALTDRERDMLRLLAQARGAPVARAALVGAEGGERAVDVQINRLRRKLEDDPGNPAYVQTARGVGYRLVAEYGR